MTIPTSLEIEARYAAGAPVTLALILAAAPRARRDPAAVAGGAADGAGSRAGRR